MLQQHEMSGRGQLPPAGMREKHAHRISEAKTAGEAYRRDADINWGEDTAYFSADMMKPKVFMIPQLPLKDAIFTLTLACFMKASLPSCHQIAEIGQHGSSASAVPSCGAIDWPVAAVNKVGEERDRLNRWGSNRFRPSKVLLGFSKILYLYRLTYRSRWLRPPPDVVCPKIA